MKKMLPFLLVVCLCLCSCKDTGMARSSEGQTYVSAQEPGTATLLLEDLPPDFVMEYTYNAHSFRVIRIGNEVLKYNDFQEKTFYRKNGSTWDCRYFENGAWGSVIYSEDEDKTAKRCLYFICDASGLDNGWENVGVTQAIAGLNAVVYRFTDDDGNLRQYWYCDSLGAVLKVTENGRVLGELTLFQTENAAFDSDIPDTPENYGEPKEDRS